MSKKLIVIGGSGYVGSMVCREGVKRGFEVISMSRRQYPVNFNINEEWMNKCIFKKGEYYVIFIFFVINLLFIVFLQVMH